MKTKALTALALKDIAKILDDEFGQEPGVKSAKALLNANFTREDFREFGRTRAGQAIPDPWKLYTENAIRNLQLGVIK